MASSHRNHHHSHHHYHHSDPVIGQIPVPHGPQQQESDSESSHGGRSPPGSPPTAEKKLEMFRQFTHPDDSYTRDGTYWADLPIWQRLRFIGKVDNAEAKKELKAIGAMMKKDPLSPVSWYWRNAILPGAGLGLEGYILFSIGNLEPLFKAVWPECWGSNPTVCSANSIAAVTYLEIVGIMFGQMGVGVIGDWLGRRWMLIQDAVIMFLGAAMLTASWGLNLQGWIACYIISLFIFSFGVGGEYPATATSSMETSLGAGQVSTREDRLHRGRNVTLAFLMQGWGQFWNQVILIVCMFIFNRVGDPPYGKTAAQLTFRISLGIPAVGLLWLAYYRTWKMPRPIKPQDYSKGKADADAEKQTDGAEAPPVEKKKRATGYDMKSLKLTFSHFGGRILATAGTWFCNDVFFYGNKLFQSQFISVISSSPDSVMTKWIWNLVNCSVSLVGYYMASMLIDNKIYGRKNMQQLGFLMCFVFFVIPAFHYDYYTRPEHIHAFQAMYFLSSFFNQFGPNAVTFLAAGEVYPTSIRATAHGFSACIGKAGALLASVLYAYIDTQTKFYVVPWFGLAGMLLTWGFLPDTTGLDLSEQERRWAFIVEGKEKEYHGVAVHPQHLSLWERIRGVGKQYDPQMDWDQKIEEMRNRYLNSERDQEYGAVAATGGVVSGVETANAQTPQLQAQQEREQRREEFTPEIKAYFDETSARELSDEKAVDLGPAAKE
ncbi:major facilitator superfamily transporter [Zalerion maritima]|uniref:Major facilitator superfamily transporter n=1 Tax=Zalerion maritima TaxID=339359 RepID=A0AAD5RM41_9PEZI|nr:major facilitator superfamily transporter [Zalerion maritima]